MQGSQSSTTAKYMALFRAQESALPEGERLFDDPFAVSFLSSRLRLVGALFRIPIVRAVLSRWMDARWPGARTSAIARPRLIDDWASAAATTRVQQVVILGAGFDCRAWRLPAFSGIPIFEIHYPATSAEKRRLIGKLGAPTQQVCFVPVDFERESLAEGLAKVGFRADKRTLVIWEGVTNYLTAEAVDATVRWVATLAEGSRLIFTYVNADLINGSDRDSHTAPKSVSVRTALIEIEERAPVPGHRCRLEREPNKRAERCGRNRRRRDCARRRSKRMREIGRRQRDDKGRRAERRHRRGEMGEVAEGERGLHGATFRRRRRSYLHPLHSLHVHPLHVAAGGADADDREIDRDRASVFERQRHLRRLALDQWMFEAGQHDVVAAGRELDVAMGGDRKAVLHLAHLHHVALHRHLVDLDVGEIG